MQKREVAKQIFMKYVKELAERLGVEDDLVKVCARVAELAEITEMEDSSDDYRFLVDAQTVAEEVAWAWARERGLDTDDEVAEFFNELRYKYWI